MTKFILFGLGMVGASFLRIVKKEHMFDANCWYAIDKNNESKSIFTNIGGKPQNFSMIDVQLSDYTPIFSLLEEGDYLLDFSACQSNTDLLKICLEKNIHYLSTCSLPYEKPDDSVPDYHDFCIYRNIKKNAQPSAATSIIEFGMNPGMVSCFAKQAIKEIIKKDTGDFVTTHRKELLALVENEKYAEAAQMLEVDIIHVSDIDTTECKFIPNADTLYSTWNIDAFCKENTAPCEISLGTDIDVEKLSAIKQDNNAYDGFFIANDISIHTPEQSYSPYGSFVGHIVPHEEIYTIAYFFSLYKQDKLVYKPSVYFVYLPSPVAVESLVNGLANNFLGMNEYIIGPDDIAKGGEAVGVVVNGKNFQTRYFGNCLEAPIEGETPTILQVSASAFAAFRYMLDSPNEGFLLPEELNDEKILEYARPILQKYISFECPPLERTFFSKYGA